MLLLQEISNTYIIPCDIWSEKIHLAREEAYSWYMVSDILDEDSWIRVNRKSELVRVVDESKRDDLDKIGNRMIGISYVCDEEAENLRDNLERWIRILCMMNASGKMQHLQRIVCS